MFVNFLDFLSKDDDVLLRQRQGEIDVTDEFKSAIHAATFRTLYVPRGIYRLRMGEILIHSVHITGDLNSVYVPAQPRPNDLSSHTVLFFDGSGTPFDIKAPLAGGFGLHTNGLGCLSNVEIKGTKKIKRCIQMWHSHGFKLDNVIIRDCDIGLYARNVSTSRIANVFITGCNMGFSLVGCNGTRLEGCSAYNNDLNYELLGFYYQSSDPTDGNRIFAGNVSLRDCNSELPVSGIHLTARGVGMLNVSGGHFEGGRCAFFLRDNVTNATIIGVRTILKELAYISRSHGIVIQGCSSLVGSKIIADFWSTSISAKDNFYESASAHHEIPIERLIS